MSKHGGSTSLPFERTDLWRHTFRVRSDDQKADLTTFYSSHLRDLRDKARVLVDRIRTDMPYLTIHDITHLDALWEVGSAIAGPSYPLTVAEGYVFGASVLLHDAAMCLAAFPRGVSEIAETDEWKDAIVMLYTELCGTQPRSEEIRKPPREIVERAVPIVLRLLHARQAEQLPRTKWINAAGDEEYLIENGDLRNFYGQMIGKIARSHGESISWVQSELVVPLGSLASHDGGSVNGLKLACLLASPTPHRSTPAEHLGLSEPY